jgi:hypothetical protein
MPYPSATTFPGQAQYPGIYSTYRFTTPIVQRDYQMSGALRATYQFGLTVMRIDGQWVTTEFPSWEQEQSADLFFRGGYVHIINSATATALAAAGFEVEPI